MANTPLIASHIERIDKFNDQLWYYLFATEELNNQLQRFTDAAKQNYVEDLFNNNQFKRRIHVRVSSLSSHQRENKNLTFGAYISACYEIGSKYLTLAYNTLKSFNNILTHNWDSSLGPEGNIQALLQSAGLPSINRNYIDTITYLRLRRNHHTHINDSINAPLQSLITSSAARLNTFWRQPRNAVNLDFTRILIRSFGQDETFQLIKVLRICLQEMDENIAALLNKNKVIEYIVMREYDGKTSRMNSYVLQQRVSKVKNICRTELGLNCTDVEIDPFARAIGIFIV